MLKRETDVKHEPEQLRKMFIGGLDYSTTDEGLKAFYEKWGTVVDVVVMKDPKTRRSRGFGFITYSKASMVDDAMNNRPHKIDGRQVEPKRAVPRDLCSKGEANVRKLFIGGIGKQTTKEDLEDYFKKYGTLTDCAIVVTKDTGEPRGFGFVEYEDVDSADKVILIRSHEIKGRKVEIKKAIARDEINKDGRRGGIGRGGMRDGRGGNGDFRNGQGNFGGWNNQGNNWAMNGPSPWSHPQGPSVGNWGNNSCWNNNQNGYPGNFNNPGHMNNDMNSMNNIGGGMGNMGGGMNNMGGNMGSMGGNMGNMGGNMGNMGNMGGNMNNMGGNMNNMGGNMGNMGGNMGNMGGNMGNMGGNMNNMGGGLGNLCNNMNSLGGMNLNNMGGMNNGNSGNGMGGNSNNMYGGNMGGGMGFNNFGPSGGGPMRGGYGSSNNRPTPYPTSEMLHLPQYQNYEDRKSIMPSYKRGMNNWRGGGPQYPKYYQEKSGGRREGNRAVRF